MNPPKNKRFFFIHVMKTGGTSFSDLLRVNFEENQRYPEAYLTPDMHLLSGMEAYVNPPKFVADVNALEGQLQMVRAHVPYSVRALLKGHYQALTVLRDPIDRTLSYLKHARRYHPEHTGMELEEIYEDQWLNESFIHNYQTKIFSMSVEEALAENHFPDGAPHLPSPQDMKDNIPLSPELAEFRKKFPTRFIWGLFATGTAVINVDSKRLVSAKENLDAIELVGITENYDLFLKRLVDRYDWKIGTMPHHHAGEQEAISPEFRHRIKNDNAFDMELYEYARSLST